MRKTMLCKGCGKRKDIKEFGLILESGENRAFRNLYCRECVPFPPDAEVIARLVRWIDDSISHHAEEISDLRKAKRKALIHLK